MPSADYPKHAQVLVIGGGPGGSYAATALAREGFNVVLLEMAKFPRYHIGESLLPSSRHFLRFIGAEDKVAEHGFARKPGSAIKFNQYLSEGYTDFVALGASNNAWNVPRAEFDHILLQHAASSGVKVYEQTRVTEIKFGPSQGPPPPSPTARLSPERTVSEGLIRPLLSRLGRRRPSTVEFAESRAPQPEQLGRPESVLYETAHGGTGEITFDYLVDASGRAGIMSTKYLKSRKFNASLKNVAVWGYWKDTGVYARGSDRENAPWFEALSDETGWAWFIPLHNGLTSIGVVMEQKALGIRSRASSSASSPILPGGGGRNRSGSGGSESLSARTSSTLADRYLSLLQLAPGVLGLIGDGELVRVHYDDGMGVLNGVGGTDGGRSQDDIEGPVVRSASDYSYQASEYAGEGWRLVGDAGAFIDPFFSSGIHLAMTGGLAAAGSIAASIRGDCSEVQAAKWHNRRVSLSYTRFLIVVLSAYKQIRAQADDVLVDVDEGNFERAFAFLRPIIQGGADVGIRLSEDEVQRALDFCVHLFDPTTPEQHEQVRKRLEAMYGAGERPTPRPQMSRTISEDAPPDDPRSLLDVRAPVVDPAQLDKLLRRQLSITIPEEPRFATNADAQRERDQMQAMEVKMVLEKVNARRVIHGEHGGICNLEEEELGGLALRLKRGELGLRKVVGSARA